MTNRNKPLIINVSFKTKSKDEQMLYAWLLTKTDYYGVSEYIKMVLKEKMSRE